MHLDETFIGGPTTFNVTENKVSFPNENDLMLEAMEKGFPTHMVMQEAQEKGFHTYTLMQ